MKINGEKFKNYVMCFSYQARRKEKLKSFRQELIRLRHLDEDELSFEYIGLKTEYEHKKNVLSLFIISIALGVLMNVWNKFFSFMQLALQYAASEDASAQVTKVSFFLSIGISLFITVAILLLLLSLSNDIKKIRRKIMIIENVKKTGGNF